MSNETSAVPVELLPCPFCGTEPKLPDGDGTQYEIWCEDCGGAVSSVQIRDLMTLEERAADSFTDFRHGEEFIERAKLEAIERWNTRAQPAAPVTTQDQVEAKVIAYTPGMAQVEFQLSGRLPQWLELGEQVVICTHAAAAEVERLRADVKRLDLMIAQADYNYDQDRAQFKNQLAELEARVAPVRNAYAFLLKCRADTTDNAIETGALRDAYEWLRTSAEELGAHQTGATPNDH